MVKGWGEILGGSDGNRGENITGKREKTQFSIVFRNMTPFGN